jgi:hypothetical protein
MFSGRNLQELQEFHRQWAAAERDRRFAEEEVRHSMEEPCSMSERQRQEYRKAVIVHLHAAERHEREMRRRYLARLAELQR